MKRFENCILEIDGEEYVVWCHDDQDIEDVYMSPKEDFEEVLEKYEDLDERFYPCYFFKYDKADLEGFYEEW